jgi:hypothetical protein
MASVAAQREGRTSMGLGGGVAGGEDFDGEGWAWPRWQCGRRNMVAAWESQDEKKTRWELVWAQIFPGIKQYSRELPTHPWEMGLSKKIWRPPSDSSWGPVGVGGS